MFKQGSKRARMRAVAVGVALAVVVTAAVGVSTALGKNSGRWVEGDYHNHTFLTDGSYTQLQVIHKAFDTYGLDWFSNSEHGGTSTRDPFGNPLATPVWRWASIQNWSWPIVRDLRPVYSSKTLLQGVEWNVPTHEHASVTIATNEPTGTVDFEYLFDASDKDTSRIGYSKDNTSTQAAIDASSWLEAHYRDSSWFIVNHPSRKLLYTVADFRDFNNAAPDVAFGFEAIPGHQKAAARGEFGNFFTAYGKMTSDPASADPTVTAMARTYGGADYMLAKVGGLWDSMLGEGRHFWAFTASDFHDDNTARGGADFWPGEYNQLHNYQTGTKPTDVVNSLRSGNAFITEGDLIKGLQFKADAVYKGRGSATMGQTLAVKKGGNVLVTISFCVPDHNANGNKNAVNHVDVIRGNVGGKIAPTSADYSNPTNSTTAVVARFGQRNWSSKNSRAGWHTVQFLVKNVQKDTYLRLRGTNMGLSVPDQTDADGNPLRDDLVGANSAAQAWADLWFYSNPVFIHVQ
jgi:hypothetical protein